MKPNSNNLIRPRRILSTLPYVLSVLFVPFFPKKNLPDSLRYYTSIMSAAVTQEFPVDTCNLFMQNEPNFQCSLSKLSAVLIETYNERTLPDTTKTNPIEPNTDPIEKRPKINANFSYDRHLQQKNPLVTKTNEPNRTQSQPNTNPKRTQFPPPFHATSPDFSRLPPINFLTYILLISKLLLKSPNAYCFITITHKDHPIAETQQNSPGIENWLRLIRADGVGPTIFARLLKYFNTIDRIMAASVNSLANVSGIGLKTAEAIARTRDKFNVEKELALADKLGVWILNYQDNRYPPALKQIYDPPPVLYIKGTLTRQDCLAVAIVGSRRCSNYGSEQASRFAHMLASAGFTIVSGMARGIDTAAHRGALSAQARTIAVQGCGLANIFPPENKKLYGLIADSGACVSELPLSYEPLSENFPARNRIISGLAMGVIVIEAWAKSGAIITAKAAIDQNREVMAVPGRIDSPCNAGAHRLLKDGARLIDGVETLWRHWAISATG